MSVSRRNISPRNLPSPQAFTCHKLSFCNHQWCYSGLFRESRGSWASLAPSSVQCISGSLNTTRSFQGNFTEKNPTISHERVRCMTARVKNSLLTGRSLWEKANSSSPLTGKSFCSWLRNLEPRMQQDPLTLPYWKELNWTRPPLCDTPHNMWVGGIWSD